VTSSSGKKGVGISAAAEMLNGLDKENRDRVLEIMIKKDPSLAHLIEEHLVKIDDLVTMTNSMLQDFVKEVPLEKLGMALKFAEPSTLEFFHSKLSRTMSEDLKFSYDKKVPREKAHESYQEVLAKVREMVEQGKLILGSNPDELV
jgi:flagellar motor switch protein FliG